MLNNLNQSIFSEDDIDDSIEEKIQNYQKYRTQRSGVSEEVYGVYNRIEDFEPRIIVKSTTEKSQIKSHLDKLHSFKALSQTDQEIVLDSIKIVTFKKDEKVIIQGEEGKCLYIVEEGEFECFRQSQQSTTPTFIRTYGPGDFFGELALLYCSPRAASIKSKTDSILYELDRETFNAVVKKAAIHRRELYSEFVKDLHILSHLTEDYEKIKISDYLDSKVFAKDKVIIPKGDTNSSILFVFSGEVEANINDQTLFTYKPGDHFGEIPLLIHKSQPFSFIAKNDETTVLEINEQAYNKTLIIVEKILQEKLDIYSQYI